MLLPKGGMAMSGALLWLSDEAWAAIEPHLPKNQPGAPGRRAPGDLRHHAHTEVRQTLPGRTGGLRPGDDRLHQVEAAACSSACWRRWRSRVRSTRSATWTAPT